ncbi:MAG: peptide methionine sulfoxide reductase [Rubritepida sp.]|nr:peptide methionine sulfoxide reductase [Rubritepida sp.]
MTARRAFLAFAGAIGLARPLAAQAVAAQFGVAMPPAGPGMETAIFAGGCFWCMEGPFDALDGVVATTSGYTGGSRERPTYQQVSAGGSGHIESVHVLFDPARMSYGRLLEVFWRNVDPLDAGGQFCDRGDSYATAIFVAGAEQRRAAEASKMETQARLGRPLATAIRDATAFWPAEDYHQDYYLKNPIRYRVYRYNCGRDARLRAVWGAEAGGGH